MRGRVLILAALATLIFATGARAAVYVYWGNNGSSSIGRADVDGASNVPAFIPGIAEVQSIVTDKQHIYWLNAIGSPPSGYKIGRASIDGTSPQPDLLDLIDPVGEIAIDANHLYWTNNTDQTIGRANLDGTGVEQNWLPLPGVYPDGIAISGGFIYWTDYPNGRIGRANIDGGGVNMSLVTAISSPGDLRVSSSYIYWSRAFPPANNGIGRVALDGVTMKDPNFIVGSSVQGICGIALDEDFQNIWWANNDGGSLGRANLLDGSGRSDNAVPASQPCGIDVDHGFAIPPATPSNQFSFGKLKRNTKKGTATLAVAVPGPGLLTLHGKGVKTQRPAAAARHGRARTVGAAGTFKLKIVPKGKAKRKLGRIGKAKLKLTITFTPNGGSANAQPKTVRLKKR